MKNKKIILFVLTTLFVFLLSGCSDGQEINQYSKGDRFDIKSTTFTESDLVYDKNTKIVYINIYTAGEHYVKTPYLSENGQPYRYINGKLVEVVND